MRTQEQVLAMLAELVAHKEQHGWHPHCGYSEQNESGYWIADEERAAYRQVWRETGFFVMEKTEGGYNVSASKGLLDKIGNFNPNNLKHIWTTGEEGRESRV